VRLLTALAAVLLGAAPSAHAMDADVRSYDEARRRGDIGTVAGRVYAERAKPTAPDVPMAGAAVVAMPHSESLQRHLDELKAGARKSAAAFRDAAPQMRRARDAYEKELWQSGGAELVRSIVADSDGRFTLADLPAGRWMVWVTTARYVSATSPKPPPRDRERFRLPPRMVGYTTEQWWLREVDVTPGTSTTLELTDRNVWFTGVVEERVLDAGSSRH
jgi:hypothetical protein